MEDLNLDMLTLLLLTMDIKDMLTMRLTCKKFKIIASGNSFWKMRFERDFPYQLEMLHIGLLPNIDVYMYLHYSYYHYVSVYFKGEVIGKIWIGWRHTVEYIRNAIVKLLNSKCLEVLENNMQFSTSGYIYHRRIENNKSDKMTVRDEITTFDFDSILLPSYDRFSDSKEYLIRDRSLFSSEKVSVIISDNGGGLGTMTTCTNGFSHRLSPNEEPVRGRIGDRLEFFKGKFVLIVNKYIDRRGRKYSINHKDDPRLGKESIFDLYRRECK